MYKMLHVQIMIISVIGLEANNNSNIGNDNNNNNNNNFFQMWFIF